jgi:glycerol-3-phosphate dehydrogenase
VVHVAGGKYTTYRAMSEEAADLIAPGPSTTAENVLGGNTKHEIDALLTSAAEIAARHSLPAPQVERIIRSYGVQAPNLLAYLPQSARSGLTRVECAEIAFAVEHEMAETLADVMFVSTYWGYELRWTRETLTPLAEEMGRRLNWTAAKISEQLSAFL